MGSRVSAELRRLVAARAGFTCEYCLIHQHDVHFGCEVDHIVSEKHSGPTLAENLAFARFYCNRHKGSDIASMDPQTGKLVKLFNPRVDVWAEHFQLRGGRIKWRKESERLRCGSCVSTSWNGLWSVKHSRRLAHTLAPRLGDGCYESKCRIL